MSNLPPPPPPPAMPYGTAPYGGPTAGSLGAAPTDTAGLRTAATALFWVVTAVSVLLTAAMFSRRSVWQAFSEGDASISDLQDADAFVGAAALLMLGVAIAAGIVVSIWSLRTARHARRTGAANVSPGLACGGWYIPLANTIVPFVQLRRVVDHRQRPRRMVNLWQAVFIVAYLCSATARSAGVGLETADSFSEVESALDVESFGGVVATLAFALAAYVAGRAMRVVDAL